MSTSKVDASTNSPAVAPSAAFDLRVPDLPPAASRILGELVAQATGILGDTLRAIVLFGSAAEGRLRATSDINVAIVLTRFEPARIDPLRETLVAGSTAVQLNVMWLLESEIAAAAEAFAVKFADIGRRRRVLYGEDPFAHLSIPRAAAIRRLQQVTLNLILRLRARYTLDSLREERLARLIAETAAPLRSSAAELLELQGDAPATSPREALERLTHGLAGDRWDAVLAAISDARETGTLAPGTAGPIVIRLIDLACHLHARAIAMA